MEFSIRRQLIAISPVLLIYAALLEFWQVSRGQIANIKFMTDGTGCVQKRQDGGNPQNPLVN
jgi:hypothetical protein